MAGIRFPSQLCLQISATHDRIRKGAQQNAKWARKHLEKNGKFFVAPEKSSENFKALFARLAAEGAGRPVDQHGFADGPWTPETLAEAISTIYSNEKGIELRAVQVWFQQNDNGISDDNIKWLARIFGCEDPVATSQWQAELKAAKDRLARERREKRSRSTESSRLNSSLDDAVSKRAGAPHLGTQKKAVHRSREVIVQRPPTPRTLAEQCERMLSGGAPMNLLIGYWLVFCGLGLMNYVLGTLSVTYSPTEGLDKQVGFIWAPTLTVLPLVILPLYIYFVSDLTTYWKRIGRPNSLPQNRGSIEYMSVDGWYSKVNEFSFSFWAIGFFCFLFVFAFQWVGIYLPAYISGSTNGVQVDRYLVALARPEIISTTEAMLLSAFGYLYTASYIAVFMIGLLFFVIIVLDFHDIYSTAHHEAGSVDRYQVHHEGQKVIWGGYRLVVLALWLANCVKLQVTYLSSDGENFVSWLETDAMSAFLATSSRNGWLENSSISHFTTFMMMIVTVTIFILCMVKVLSIFDCLGIYDGEHSLAHDHEKIVNMLFVISLVAANLLLIGKFTGFSILLAISAVASLHVLAGPKLRIAGMIDATSEVLH